MPVHNALFVSELIKFNLNLTKVLRSTVVDDTPRSTNSLENTLRTSSLENTFSCIKGTPNRLLAHTPYVARTPYVAGRGSGWEGGGGGGRGEGGGGGGRGEVGGGG